MGDAEAGEGLADRVEDEFIEAGQADLHRIAQGVPPVIIAEILGSLARRTT
jgi:hypothetical protein